MKSMKITGILTILVVALSIICLLLNRADNAKQQIIDNLQCQVKELKATIQHSHTTNTQLATDLKDANIQKQEDISDVKKANDNELIMQFNNRLQLIQKESVM